MSIFDELESENSDNKPRNIFDEVESDPELNKPEEGYGLELGNPVKAIQAGLHEIWPDLVDRPSPGLLYDWQSNIVRGMNERVTDLVTAPIQVGENYLGEGRDVTQAALSPFGGRADKDSLAGEVGKFAGDAIISGATTAGASMLQKPAIDLATKMSNWGIKEFATVGDDVVAKASSFFPRTWAAIKAGGREVLDMFRADPAKAVLLDLGISVPQAGGAYYGEKGEKFIGDLFGVEVAGDTGKTIGSLAPAAIAASLWKTAKTIKGAVSVDKEQTKRMAGEILKANMSRDITETKVATGDFNTSKYSDLTLDEATGDPGLAAFRRGFIRGGGGDGGDAPTVRSGRSRDWDEAQNRSLLKGIEEGFNPPATTTTAKTDDTFIAIQNQKIKQLEDVTAKTLEEAQRKVAKLAVDTPIDQVEKTVADEVYDKIIPAARKAEKEIWNAAGVDTWDNRAMIEKAKLLLKELHPSEIDPLLYDMANSRKTLPPFSDSEYMSKTRTLLTDAIRENNANKAWRKNRPLKELLDSWENDVVPFFKDEITDEALKQKLADARNFSRKLNDVITRGPLGKVLGYDKTGGLRVEEEKLMSSLLKGKTDSLLGMRKLMDASEYLGEGGKEQMKNIAADYIKAEFGRTAIDPNGQFNPTKAISFVNKHEQMLDEFYPTLKQELLDAGNAEIIAKQSSKQLQKEIAKFERNDITSRYLKDEARTGVVMRSKTPTKTAKEVMTEARKDPTGKAVEGAQADFYERMLDHIAPPRNMVDELGNNRLSPARLRTFIKTHGGAVSEIYGPHAEQVLKDVSQGVDYKEMIGKGTAVGGGSETFQRTAEAIKNIAGSVFLIAGSRLYESMLGATGPHGLLVSGTLRSLGAKAAKARSAQINKEITSLVERALYEPSFATELMSMKTTKELGEALLRRGFSNELVDYLLDNKSDTDRALENK